MDGTQPPSAGRRERLFAAVAAVSTLLAIMFALLYLGERGGDGEDPRIEEMTEAARSFIFNLTTFDAATLDDSWDRVVAMATGPFAEQADVFFNSEIRQQLKEAQASSRGEIRELFVQSFEGDRGRVFAVVDQTGANNTSPVPLVDEFRMEVALQEVDGEWLVAEVVTLQAPAADDSTVPVPTPDGEE